MIPKAFREDERAIEGLPIRLVIALVVGVAALALMMNMLNGLGGISNTEVDWELQSNAGSNADRIVTTDTSQVQQVQMKVVDENGEPLEGGQVLITSDTAQLEGEGPLRKDVGDDGTVTVNLGSSATHNKFPDLRSGQDKGTLSVEIIPPADSNYVDKQENNRIIVVSG